MNIRFANLTDCHQIARLHKTCLTESFLGLLGIGILNILYKALAKYPGGILFVAQEGDETIGFVSGVDNVKRFYKFFLKKFWFNASFLLFLKVFSPKTLKKIFETMNYGANEKIEGLPEAELLSIAVIEKFRGQGASKMLFDELKQEFNNRNISKFKIIVGCCLIGAQKFYEKMGCVKVAETEIHKGASSKILLCEVGG
ncbi:MAG: GNAT family N-acetyltransferase [Parcubacteria group bacterium]